MSTAQQTFFPFPTNNINLLQAWFCSIKKLRKGSFQNAKLCSSHFLEDDFEKEMYLDILKNNEAASKFELKPEAVPSQNLEIPAPESNPDPPPDPPPDPSTSRQERSVKRQFKRSIPEYISQGVSFKPTVNVGTQCSDIPCCDAQIELKVSSSQRLADAEKIICMKKRLKRLDSKAFRKRIIDDALSESGLRKSQRNSVLNNRVNKKLKAKRAQNYDSKDISRAIILRGAGAKNFKNIRLHSLDAIPSNRTIERWLRHIICRPGFQMEGIRIIQQMAETTNLPNFRYGVLCFDEVGIDKKYGFDFRTQTIYGPHSKMQTVMMRGLVQP